jgi:SAM-dependent methyltransferase
MVDEAKLNAFIGRILGDLGGAFSVPMVRMGDKLGLYKALREEGPMTPSELAAKTKVAERYAREWLSHQAASAYLEYDTASGKFALPPEQAMVFADVDSPVYLQGAFDLAVSMVENQPKVEAAFRSGKGVGWGDQAPCLFCTVGRFFRPGYHNNLVSSWLPALDGLAAKLESGAKVADVGCGHGFSTIIMAKAFPKSTFVGYDFHPESVAQARVHAERHGATANTKFEVAMASDFPGKDLDLVTFFDCLHDMGDPVGAARHVRQTLKVRRKLDDRRTGGGRSIGGQSESGQPAVLRWFHYDLYPDLARSAGRRGARRAGGLRQGVVCDHARRVRQGAQGDGNSVQHGPRGATLTRARVAARLRVRQRSSRQGGAQARGRSRKKLLHRR